MGTCSQAVRYCYTLISLHVSNYFSSVLSPPSTPRKMGFAAWICCLSKKSLQGKKGGTDCLLKALVYSYGSWDLPSPKRCSEKYANFCNTGWISMEFGYIGCDILHSKLRGCSFHLGFKNQTVLETGVCK